MNVFERIQSQALRPRSSARPVDSRAALLAAAEQLFAEKGFEGTTVKDLAETAGVNVSLVSYHFGGKEGLYRTALEQFAIARLANVREILSEPESEEDVRVRMTLLCDALLRNYAERPHLYRMVQRACDSMTPLAQEIFATHFQRVFQALVSFVVGGQSRGLLRAELDPRLSVALFFMGMMQLTRMDAAPWKPLGGSLSDETFRQHVVKTAVQQFLRGTLA